MTLPLLPPFPATRWLARLLLLIFSLHLGLSAIADPKPTKDEATPEAVQSPSLPAVAVFSEPGFLNFNGVRAISPNKMVEELRSAGFQAETLNVQQMAEPGRLTPAKYAAVVLPYGNAFPLDAYPALKKYHEAGGVFVLSGIPFCHPTTLQDGKWVSPKGENFFLHDDKGIGTGAFRNPSFAGKLRVATPGYVENPLGLTASDLVDTKSKRLQYLDVASLPPEDKVTPIITMVNPQTDEELPVSAIIQHGCKEFNGAVDIWMGPVGHNLDEQDAYLASQIMLRGIAWALRAKGVIEPDRAAAVMSFAGGMRRPSPLPGGLEFKAPKAWPTFLPKSSPPARHLLVVNLKGLKPAEKEALASLQGLTSRSQPRIWLLCTPNSQFWLDWHVQKGYLDDYEVVTDWKSLFTRFKDEYKGAVVGDPNLYEGNLLAANVAGCEDLIFTTPEVARELGIPIKIDLRGKFKTFAAGLAWVWDTYGKQMNSRMSSYTSAEDLPSASFAYEIQWKAIMYWIAGPLAENRPGADPVAEKAVVARILSNLEPNGVVLGFPEYGEGGMGIGEPDGVGLISSYGQALVCTNFQANLSVTSGVQLGQMPALPPPATQPKLEKDKIYVALVVSDGDNEHLWQELFQHKYFNNPRFGEFPLAFGMGPPIIDLQPAVVQWYFEHAKPGTEFVSDVSGIGYMHPDAYGDAYKNQQAVLDGFLSWTNQYLPRLHMRSVRTVSGDDQILGEYIHGLSNMDSVFADMGRYSGREGIKQLTYTLDGKPVFRAATSWRKPGLAFLDEIRQQVGTTRPAFVNGFVHCWTWSDFDKVAAVYDARDPDMVFVTPSQLTSLYLEAQKTSDPQGH